jgi:formate dehydrogenase beta subunit
MDAPPSVERRRGRGTRRPVRYPKGRQLDSSAIDEVRAVLGDLPRRRDLLIEHLHRVQDRFGFLSARHLAALAAEMRLAQAEVYEVATFCAHFDVVKEEEAPPPPRTVRICDSISCELAGSRALHAAVESAVAESAPGSSVRVVRAPCIGACDHAPAAMVGRRQIGSASAEMIMSAITAGALAPEQAPFRDFEAYVAAGGYEVLRSVKGGALTPADAIEVLKDAGLRGMGGAGFPTARKWDLMLDAPKPRLIAINADEGEPGTFKDKFCLDTDPHLFLEGALIAASVIEAEALYIYLRDEYPQAHEVLRAEIAKIGKAGVNAGVSMHLRRGAGAYICGEESAMLESIEGKRGLPRNRPPYPAQRGLFGRPTLINNIETLHWIPQILARGTEWYQAAGRPRLYSVSGRVNDPGVKQAPSGVTARQLIDEYSGGMLDGHEFKAYLPGGASGGILPASLADLRLDFGELEPYGCFVGSGAVVVLSDQDDIRSVARNLMAFFEDESCGQCTPCRVGCEKMLHLIERPEWDAALMTELSEAMRDASICGLGQAAPNPVLSALRYFEGELR